MDDPPPAQGAKPGQYIDVEILDAIAFRTDNGKEVVLSMDQTKAEPFIVDKTGGDNAKQTDNPTQLTHMQRIKGKQDPTQQLDVEVMDCIAYRDQNGEEWVLDMQNGSGDGADVFDITDNSGDPKSTRRVHDETVSAPFGKAKSDAGNRYLTVQRNDNIAFRKANGQEVIFSAPSCDDPNSQGVDFSRAKTFSTPQGYDPTDDSDSAIAPPSLADSGDKHVYASVVKGSGFLTDDAKIAQGPFWWIRKIQAGDSWFGFQVHSNILGSSAFVTFDDIPDFDGVQIRMMSTDFFPGGSAYIDASGSSGLGSTVLTDAILKGTLLTGLHGAKITGFGIYIFNSEVNPLSEIWINTKNSVLGSKFKATLHTDTNVHTSGAMIGTAFALSKITSKDVAVGKTVDPSFLPAPPGLGTSYAAPVGNDATLVLTSSVNFPPNLVGSCQFDLTDPANPKITAA
jgi:hypothetical protein